MTKASDGGIYSGQQVYVDLVKGKVFKVGNATANGPFLYSSTASTGFLAISGDWDSTCVSPSLDPTASVVDGNNAAQALQLNSENTEIFVYNLTIQNGNSGFAGAGLSINAGVSSNTGGSVVVHDTIIRNNQSGFQAGGLAVAAGGASHYVEILDNLIVGNSASLGYSAGYVESTSSGSDAIVSVINNTIYNNTTTSPDGVGGFGCCASPGSSLVSANIFWSNTNDGLSLFGLPVDVEYNDYGALSGTAPENSDYQSVNLSVEPKFKDPSNGDFHLTGASPLIGYGEGGYCASGDADLEGHSRNFYSLCDAGAYQDTVFTDGGFENQ